ncbi:hypothetical protein [Hyphomicrobium methylovorum]|uniref:hypothetical protein n=1 Tax=Hyphomicrobium methylovorum TaxID=84 RepID=UPI001AEF12DE|nr:hypothetical protein [Hyphomicrobium methylovorum]
MRILAGAAVLASFLCAICAETAFAHEGFLEPQVKVNQVKSQDKLIACTIEFMTSVKDDIYRSGELSVVTGSINLVLADDGRPLTRFKLVGFDVASGGLERFKVDTVSLFDAEGHPYDAAKLGCDDKNDFCGEMTSEGFKGATAAIGKTGSVHLDYGRTASGAHVPVDIPVSKGEAPALVECTQKLDSGAH